MKKGEFIIWDSHFGYDIGFYSKEEGVMYGTSEIYLVTGVSEGFLSVPPHEIHSFSKELIEKLNTKYKYKREYETLLERLNIRKQRVLNEEIK